MPKPDYTLELTRALRDIRQILDSIHKNAVPSEKLVRIAWVIGALPVEMRDMIVDQARQRMGIGWAAGIKPTDWGK
jgi:hypothetical protein